MFKDSVAFSSFSVNDIEKVKQFYGEVLGLSVEDTPEGMQIKLGTGASIFVYEKLNHEPATFTILNFSIEDIEKAVDELIAKGVKIEHYDMPGIKTDEKGIARGEYGPRAMAWFKDPAGNILGVMQEK